MDMDSKHGAEEVPLALNRVDRVAAQSSPLSLPSTLEQKLPTWAHPCEFLERRAEASVSIQQNLFLRVCDLLRKPKHYRLEDRIRFRICCVLFYHLFVWCRDEVINAYNTSYKAICPFEQAAAVLSRVIDHRNILPSSEVLCEAEICRWIKNGERYQLLLADLGGPGNLFLLPNEGEGEYFWLQCVPKERGRRRTSLIRSLLNRGIHQLSWSINAHWMTSMILSCHLEYIGLKAYGGLTNDFIQPQEWRGLASESTLQTHKQVQLSETGRGPKPSRHRLESWQEDRSRKRKEIDTDGQTGDTWNQERCTQMSSTLTSEGKITAGSTYIPTHAININPSYHIRGCGSFSTETYDPLSNLPDQAAAPELYHAVEPALFADFPDLTAESGLRPYTLDPAAFADFPHQAMASGPYHAVEPAPFADFPDLTGESGLRPYTLDPAAFADFPDQAMASGSYHAVEPALFADFPDLSAESGLRPYTLDPAAFADFPDQTMASGPWGTLDPGRFLDFPDSTAECRERAHAVDLLELSNLQNQL